LIHTKDFIVQNDSLRNEGCWGCWWPAVLKEGQITPRELRDETFIET
jgi:hypothetical protein